MKISQICMIGLIVIGGLALIKYGTAVVRSASDYQTVGRIEVLASSSAVWKNATVALSLERSVTQVALSLEEPAPEAFLSLIESQRVLADQQFKESNAALADFANLPTKSQFNAQSQRTMNRITALRKEVDNMLGNPKEARDPTRLKNLPFEFKAQIAELKSLANLLTIDNNLTSNQAFALFSVQDLAWEVREFGGRARTYYAIATLNSAPVPTEMKSLIQADSARAASAWSSLQKAVQVSSLDAEFVKEIEAAGRTYFGSYLDLIASLDATMAAQSGSEQITYPIPFDAFFATSNEALDGFSELSKSAGDQVRLYWTKRKAGKLQSLVVDVSAVVVMTFLIVFAMFVISRRIASRIEYVAQAITAVTNGQVEDAVDHRKNDLREIKALTGSLEKLIDGTRKTQELMATLDDVEVREKERAEAEKDREKRLAAEAKAMEEKAKSAEAESKRLEAFDEFQKSMREVLGSASEGSFDRRMPLESRDENLAELAKIVNDVLSEMETNISDIVSGIGELAEGNLAVRMDGDRQGAFLRMKNDFNAALQVMSSTMMTILLSGNSVSGTSGDLQSAASTMSRRAESDATAVRETSEAVDVMAKRVVQVVENAKAANAATLNIQSRANETREIANSTEASMDNMKKASEEINNVVKMIEDIAFQINLLALNAGVEAARAGEAGRGFSVVASEVRALAQRSQEAVQNVNRVIGENTVVVDGSISMVKKSRNALEGIISEVEVATKQISEIATAIEQQAEGISDINGAINSVEASAQKNAASLEELTASSMSLNDDATSLNDALSKFHGVSNDPNHSVNAERQGTSGGVSNAA